MEKYFAFSQKKVVQLLLILRHSFILYSPSYRFYFQHTEITKINKYINKQKKKKKFYKIQKFS